MTIYLCQVIQCMYLCQVIGVMVRTHTGLDETSSLPLSGPDSAWDKVNMVELGAGVYKVSPPPWGNRIKWGGR